MKSFDDKTELEYKLKTAKDYEAEGKWLHAVQIYNTLIDENPGYSDAYFGLALVYEKLSNIEPAIKLLHSFIEHNRENREVRLFFGQYLLKNSRWEDAVEVLSYIMPDEEPVVSFFLGYANFMLEEYEQAKINFLNFIDFSNQSELLHEAQLYLGKTELKLNNFENALGYLKKAEVIYSNFWELNLLLAEAYYYLGMYTHAVSPVEKAVSLNSGEPLVYEWAGKIYVRTGDYLKAEKYMLKHVDLKKDISSEAYAALADIYLKTKKLQNALDYFELALKLDPENQSAINGKRNANYLLNNQLVSDV